MDAEDLFRSRPFKTRNADEYDLQQVLDLFVNPLEGLTSPFDFENTIVKGRMGSGKTMFLRANHAYYLYGLVPSLLNSEDLILPVLIRLNSFQHLKEPEDIYRAVVIKVVEEMTSAYLHLVDADKLVELHSGARSIADRIDTKDRLALSVRQLAKLGSEEYVERITAELGVKGELKHSFFNLSAEWRKNQLVELKAKPNPGIKDIEECYSNLFEGRDGRVLLLIDEAGSLDNRFFSEKKGETAYFEILMNQFRTTAFVRTKIAVYPNSYSDMLTETRYGDIVKLEHSVKDPREYTSFRTEVLKLVESYVGRLPGDIFEVADGEGTDDAIEQIVFASNGNIRRLINILDLSMAEAFKAHPESLVVTKADATNAIIEHASTVESRFTPDETLFLQRLADACKSRSTYRFRFPAMSPVLYKYTNKSQEYNLINVDEVGSGRRGNTYSFDYACCVLKNVPTHYVRGTERIDRERSLTSGVWITRVTQLSQEVLEQAELPGKIEGEIEYIREGSGFLRADDGGQYFFMSSYIIETDRGKPLIRGKRLRFYPTKLEDSNMAINIEVL